MAKSKTIDIQNIGIVFGDWKLVPMDSENWELAHRHATKDTARARKAGTVGEVKWQRIGKYYQWGTIGSALLYAADNDLKSGCTESAVTLIEAARAWNDTLREFKECVSRIARER